MLDAVICPEWQYRYYSFDARWNEGEQMGSMRDGCGDDWFLLFDSAGGAALKGFAHESPLAKDTSYAGRVQASLPDGFQGFLSEPAFSMDEVTFCLWRQPADSCWQVVARTDEAAAQHEDGSKEMLKILDGNPRTYQTWAQDFYERGVALSGVQALYAHEALTADLVHSLNPEADLVEVEASAAEIGYPLAGSV